MLAGCDIDATSATRCTRQEKRAAIYLSPPALSRAQINLLLSFTKLYRDWRGDAQEALA